MQYEYLLRLFTAFFAWVPAGMGEDGMFRRNPLWPITVNLITQLSVMVKFIFISIYHVNYTFMSKKTM